MENMKSEQKSLPRLLRETEMMIHRYIDTKRKPGYDPERGQGRILALLKKTGPLAQKDMAYLLGIRQQSLGELVRKLEDGGLVSRAPQPEDQRIMIVSLTEAGQALELPKTPMEGIFECLDAAEQENLRSYLERICTQIEEMLPEGTPDPRMFPGPDGGFGPGRGPEGGRCRPHRDPERRCRYPEGPRPHGCHHHHHHHHGHGHYHCGDPRPYGPGPRCRHGFRDGAWL